VLQQRESELEAVDDGDIDAVAERIFSWRV
jgi:hypothetical protein